jgi:hypothetical protein
MFNWLTNLGKKAYDSSCSTWESCKELWEDFQESSGIERFVQFYFAFCEGFATGVTAADNIYTETENLFWSVFIVLPASFVCDFIINFNFQGKSILEAAKKNVKIHSNSPINPVVSAVSPLLNSASSSFSYNTVTSNLKNGDVFIEIENSTTFSPKLTNNKKNSWIPRLLMFELPLLIADSGKNLNSHLFLLLQFYRFFSATPKNSPDFWLLLVGSYIINRFYCLINETAEATEGLTGEKPFYQKLFKPLAYANKKILDLSLIIGTLEHILFEDMLPWVALILPIYSQNAYIFYSLLALETFLSIPIGLYVFAVTYCFQTLHSIDFLKNLNPDLSRYKLPSSKLNLKQLYWAKKGIDVVGPVHGANVAMAYLVLLSYLPDPYSLPISLIACALLFLGSALGTHKSEVRETKNEFDKEIEEIESWFRPASPTPMLAYV